MLSKTRSFRVYAIEDLLESAWSSKLSLADYHFAERNKIHKQAALLSSLLVSETWEADQAFSITKNNVMSPNTILHLLNDTSTIDPDNNRGFAAGRLISLNKTDKPIFQQWTYLECQSINPDAVSKKIVEIAEKIIELLIYQERAAKAFYMKQEAIELEVKPQDGVNQAPDVLSQSYKGVPFQITLYHATHNVSNISHLHLIPNAWYEWYAAAELHIAPDTESAALQELMRRYEGMTWTGNQKHPDKTQLISLMSQEIEASIDKSL